MIIFLLLNFESGTHLIKKKLLLAKLMEQLDMKKAACQGFNMAGINAALRKQKRSSTLSIVKCQKRRCIDRRSLKQRH